MMSCLRSLSLVFILGFACPSFAHPAFQHHFNNIVDSNPCLKMCMDQATESGTELSLLKTANVTGFLLDLNRICSIISTARTCISGCKIDSNPFALESMVVLCNQESLAEVASVSQCLQEKGDSVLEECREQCDDYQQINDQVHRLTQALPTLHRPAEISRIMGKIGEACTALTCSDRCTVRELSQQCISLGDGIDAGAVVKSMVEKVLIAQRRDLERMKLVETLAQSTPAQCIYMYVPEIMFDPSKEKIAQSVAASGVERHMSALSSTGAENDQKQDLNLALSQLQAHLLKKQMQLLDVQEKNLMRETQKLDLEFQLLLRKKARSDRFFN